MNKKGVIFANTNEAIKRNIMNSHFNISPEKVNTKLTKSDRKRIFKYAHALFKGEWFKVSAKFYKGAEPTFGECLSYSYQQTKYFKQKKYSQFISECKKVVGLYSVKVKALSPDQMLENSFKRGEEVYCDGY